MQDVETRQYGLWPSPISARSLAGGKRFSELAWDSDSRTLVWLEGRSDRSVLVSAKISEAGLVGAPRDLTSDLDVRARVGYGGGDFTVAHGRVFFAEAKSGRLYRQDLTGGQATSVTPAFGSVASPRLTNDGKAVVYVHQDSDEIDRLAVVDAEGRSWPQVLTSGHDFYTQQKLSADGRYLAFVAWDHPQMPWDGSLLCLAAIQKTGALPAVGEVKVVAGGTSVAVFQPEFTPDGKLLYVSDESGFAQLHCYDLATAQSRQITSSPGGEYSVPNWAQDLRTYGVIDGGHSVVAAIGERGFAKLHRVDLATGAAKLIEAVSVYTDLLQITVSPDGRRVAMVASAPHLGPRVIVYDLDNDAVTVVARATSESFLAGDLAKAMPLFWPTTGNDEAHGLFYPPTSSRYSGSGRPPLMVMIHGGPTSQARASWSGQTQFFTSRGYGVLWVNHRGSTGYGRAYMLKQRRRWGEVDVDDAVSGARHLAQRGEVDGDRVVIMGGSAGGYTVLQAMVDQPEFFAAGICLYGIANQFTLVADTHKFEARYCDSLLGPLPEAAELYRRRSPLFHAANIKRPLAVFQGSIDKVVPQNQSDAIVKALQRNGTPYVYHCYEGEGHGFRKAETIEHLYQAIDQFLREHVIYR